MERTIRKFTSYKEPVLKCSCGSEFFEKISANRYKITQTDLSNGQRPIKADHAVSLLRCLCCDKIHLPTVSYQTNPVEKELANDIVNMLEEREKLLYEDNLSEEETKLAK